MPADTTQTETQKRFWLFQCTGWLAYYGAMTFSRLSMFPLRYMVVTKLCLTLAGFLLSLALWRGYRQLLRSNPTVITMVVISVIASYAIALVWTAADNLMDIPIAGALLDRHQHIRSVFQLFSGSVYNAFTMLAWSMLYFGIKHNDALQSERERSLRAESLSQQARLEALRYQLQPHFLFNTLNAVSTLVAEQRNDDANRMIARLSEYLRLTLSAPVTDEVPLAEELDFVQRYLEIERVRFGERLAIEVNVGVDVLHALVPSMILQPVVENAIRHGIAPREDGGRIGLTAMREGRTLHLVVTDDGPEWNVNSATNGDGANIGLRNIRERLQTLYGDQHRLAISSDVLGTRVAVVLPFRTAVA